MVKVRLATPREEYVNANPQPGLFVFTRGHYSMVWMPWEDPLNDFAETWKPTDEEKLHSWNSIVVNTGTYSISDSTLTTWPMVAKTPEFIGGESVYTYRVEGDTLWLEMFDTYSHDGIQDPGIGRFTMPLKLVRVE